MTQRYEDVARALTAPGAPFEVVTETVRGRPMKTFKNREHSLREKVAAAAARGDVDFLVQGDRRLTYGEFARGVWGAARALARDHGLAKGDRVAILSYNCPDWIVALFGATSAGGIAVGLNGWWAAEELEYGLADSSSRFLVVDERLYPRVEPFVRRLGHVEKIFYI